MLINPRYKVGDIVTFKIIGGEELIARYHEENLSEIMISKPASLVPTGQGSIGMVPSVFSAEINSNTIALQKSSIVFSALSHKDFADEYIRATTSIKPASSLSGVLDAKGSQIR